MNLRKNIVLFIFISGLAFFMLMQATIAPAQDSRMVLLPESDAKQIMRLCSRNPPNVDGVWTPSAAILETMETRIDKIADLESRHGTKSVRIKDPRQAYRQYVGISIRGKKYIYINGMCEKPFSKNWHDTLQDVCDGGSCFWGVLYDVQNATFSDLATNGNG